VHVLVQVELEPVQALQQRPVGVAERVLGRIAAGELAQATQPRAGRVMFAEKPLELFSLDHSAGDQRGEQITLLLGDVLLELAAQLGELVA